MPLVQVRAVTPFPKFDVPELDLTDCVSSDDDSERKAKYATKEDQDVAVFVAIAERMSVESLLHILQGHARAQNLAQYAHVLETDAARRKHVKNAQPQRPHPPVKRFRFAKDSRTSGVKCVVHKVRSLKRYKLWWTDDEMQEMRMQAIDAVKYFRKYRANFVNAVEVLATSDPGTDLDTAIKQMSKDAFARGLETHICTFLAETRQETVTAVLEEQRECRLCADSYDLTAESLRGQSLAYSAMPYNLARQLGECDHIAALKASLSKWSIDDV